jgi:hypothetical protein
MCRVKPYVKDITKIRVHEVRVECRPNWVMPLTGGFTPHRDLPEIHWRNQGKTGGGHYEKQIVLPKMEKSWQTGRGHYYEK